MAQLSGAATKLDALKWRCIGPPRGGRVVAVAGDPEDRSVFYFGACAGGVWKTIDGGIYWRCVSDGFLGSAAIGALALARSDPNVIYAGTGETEIRLDVSYGDGVYKSTDAGRTWSHLGLAETRFIGRIRIHPGTPISSTSPHSATHSARTRNAESSDRATVARPGTKCCIAMPIRAPSISTWIRTTRASCSRRSGRRAGASGTWPAASREAASFAQRTAARPGSRFRAVRVCRQALSASSGLLYRPRARVASGRWWRRKRKRRDSTGPRITVKAGRWSPRIAI